VCEFTSKRKRMSCIYQTEDGRYILMTKGADSVIKDECLASSSKEGVLYDTTQEKVNTFAGEGLRTLFLA
jgi:phospholipid-translocating ATPase